MISLFLQVLTESHTGHDQLSKVFIQFTTRTFCGRRHIGRSVRSHGREGGSDGVGYHRLWRRTVLFGGRDQVGIVREMIMMGYTFLKHVHQRALVWFLDALQIQ